MNNIKQYQWEDKVKKHVGKAFPNKRPAFMCFKDLEKAFDRIQLKDLMHLLLISGVPFFIIKGFLGFESLA